MLRSTAAGRRHAISDSSGPVAARQGWKRHRFNIRDMGPLRGETIL